MKKFFALLTALLLAVLPVCAETTEEIEISIPVLKYMAEGQALTTDTTIALGDGFLSMLEEDMRAPVQDLLSVLSFRTTEQATADASQFGVSVMLNDTEAVSGTFAAANSNLYVGSNLLKDKVLSFSGAEIKQFLLENADAQSAEALEALFSIWSRYTKDPEGCLTALWDKLDSEKFLTALSNILEGITEANVSGDAPEKLPNASTVITVPLTKANLTDLANGLSDLLWSIPSMEKIAPIVTINDQPLTHDTLTSALTKFPNAMAGDAELKIYISANSDATYTVFTANMNYNGSERACFADVLTTYAASDTEGSTSTVWTLTVGENDLAMNGTFNTVLTESALNVDYTVASSLTKDGKTWSPIGEVAAMTVKMEESKISSSADISYTVQTDADAEAVTMAVRIDSASEDKGDHAENTQAATITMEGVGELLTVTSAGATGEAQASIVTDAAVSPMAMTEEEQNALLNEISTNAQSILLSLLGELPSSVWTLIQ